MPFRVGWVVAGIVCALPLWSVWTSPIFALSAKLLPVLVLAIAVPVPLAAIGGVAVLAPLAVPLRVWLGDPPIGSHEALELLVLPLLAGLCFNRARQSGVRLTAVTGTAWVLGGLCLASAAVVYSVQPAAFAAADGGARLLWTHSIHEYFTALPDVPAWHSAALWMESLALAGLVAHELQRRPGAGPWVAALALAGFAVAAGFSWARVLEIALRDSDPIAAGWRHLRSTRISPLLPDLNAVGSMFALATVGGLTWLFVPARRWSVSVAAAACATLCAGALWLTQSRAALAAAFIVAAVTWLRVRRPSTRSVALVLAGATVVAALTLMTSLVQVSRASSGTALSIRLKLVETSVRMAADQPLFGVGLTQFPIRSPQYAPAELVELFPVSVGGENAHNQFAQVLGELGVTGLLAFCAYLIAAGIVVTRPTSAAASAARMACVAGLAAFGLSAMFGHPFLTPVVMLTAALVMGVAMGLTPPAAALSARGRWVVGLCVLAILISIPPRVAAARRTVDLDNFVVGASPIVGVLDGVRYRRAEASSVWLVRANARVITMAFRSESASGCQASVTIDHHDAHLVTVTADRWQSVRFVFEPKAGRWATRRIAVDTSTTSCGLLVGRPVTLD